MPEEPTSSARLRHIGKTLRKIREDEGKTLGAVRRRLDRSPASLSAIENGLQPLRPRDLKYILEEYGVADPLKHGLMELAEQEREKGWWLDFKESPRTPTSTTPRWRTMRPRSTSLRSP